MSRLPVISNRITRPLIRMVDGKYKKGDLVRYMKTDSLHWDIAYIMGYEHDIIEDVIYYYGHSLEDDTVVSIHEERIVSANNLTMSYYLHGVQFLNELRLRIWKSLGQLITVDEAINLA